MCVSNRLPFYILLKQTYWRSSLHEILERTGNLPRFRATNKSSFPRAAAQFFEFPIALVLRSETDPEQVSLRFPM